MDPSVNPVLKPSTSRNEEPEESIGNSRGLGFLGSQDRTNKYTINPTSQVYDTAPINQTIEMPVLIVKPSLSKTFVPKEGLLLQYAGLVVVLLVILHYTVGLEFFVFLFDTVGLQITWSYTLVFGSILGLLVAASLGAGILAFFETRFVRWDFYDNRITIIRSSIISKAPEYTYDSIVQVYAEQKGILPTLFHYGTVVMQITGTNISKVQMKYLQHPTTTVQNIQAIINKSRFTQQTQDARFGNL